MCQLPRPSTHQSGSTPGLLGLVAWTFRLLCLSPATLVLLFYGFVLRVRWALGEWPRPSIHDPKDLGFRMHYGALLLAEVGFFAVPLGLLVLLLGVRRRENLLPSRPWRWLAFYIVTFFAAWWLLGSDLGSFSTWLAD